ncbi:MAG: cysteine--tRNA ligase [Hyphomicrobiaceae bacterium]|nr:MAG: cysteine--tRNA ligase [Hyphomicrobiaceae bacterium]
MTLTLYNTLTRRKEPFQPIDPKNVRMYVCGPTVYDYAHIGNARPVIVFDVLFRLLRHVYGPEHVTYARNITDVDDKINARAAEQHPDLPLNEAIRKVTEATGRQFHEDIAALGVLPPTVEPRATEHITEMKALIETLVARGHAYVAEDHVLFDVPSMKDYGRLSNRSLEEMEAGARVEVAPYKKDAMDFVLWKPSKPGEPAWDSPCAIAAKGRPGWHVECSAMSDRWLWEEARGTLSEAGLSRPHVFDIHGGGIDLVFPHHENEIAQSRCAHGTPVMANVWMHNGFLQVEGEKMSKSLGNFVTIRELLETDKFGNQKWHGRVLRLAMLMTHYRQPIDWTADRLLEARSNLYDWNLLCYAVPGSVDVPTEVLEPLSDDLNSPAAISAVHALARAVNRAETGKAKLHAALNLRTALEFLGLYEAGPTVELLRQNVRDRVFDERVEKLIAARSAARKAKNFKEADRIRDELSAMGIGLKDSKDPKTGEIVTTWEVRASGTTEVKR